VTQDLRPLGLPATLGVGLAGLAGLGAEYRGEAPPSAYANDISSEMLVLGLNVGMGFEVTERLSLGMGLTWHYDAHANYCPDTSHILVE
jgi:hypothetical protein